MQKIGERLVELRKKRHFKQADIAEILTAIVTYNGTIPTGCPTSQIIAFYAYQNMFQEITCYRNLFLSL